MEVSSYLSKVANVVSVEFFDGAMSDVYHSKFDNSYITHVGMEDKVKHLADLEITEELTNGVGFSPKDGKWYGWSHRAIYGFGVGSDCKKGDCHYVASTPEELIDCHADFFSDISKECADRKRAECQILPDRSGIRILHAPMKINVAENIDSLIDILDGGTVSDAPMQNIDTGFTVVKCGRGEWVAKTLGDAKEMATAFNESVS